MSANPFFVAPAGDISSGLAGIGSVLKDVGEQRKMREEEENARLANEQAQMEINDAIQSGDMNTLRMTAVKYPQVADAIYKGFQAQKDEDKSSTLGWLRQVAVAKDPMQAKSVLEREISRLDTIGRDSSVLRGELMDLESDPEGFLQSSRLGYAAIAPENEYKAYLESNKRPEANTEEGKARQDLEAGLITQEEFDRINAPEQAKFQSDVGKLLSDRQLAVQEFGENSPQANAITEAINAKEVKEPPSLSDVAGIRKEFTNLSGNFIGIKDAYKKVESSGDNAAGDLALIFSFMKILDPGSVVREQEFANAQNSAGVPEQIRNQYNRVLSGERLSPEQRVRFRGEAQNIFNAQKETQKANEQIFRSIAERQGMNPDDVVVDFVGDMRDVNNTQTIIDQADAIIGNQ
jgi:hypothetical protein